MGKSLVINDCHKRVHVYHSMVLIILRVDRANIK